MTIVVKLRLINAQLHDSEICQFDTRYRTQEREKSESEKERVSNIAPFP